MPTYTSRGKGKASSYFGNTISYGKGYWDESQGKLFFPTLDMDD